MMVYILLFSTVRLSSNGPASKKHNIMLNVFKYVKVGETENLLLNSWNTSVPLCQWRGLKWVFTDGSSLKCTDISSPQWSNISLSRDPSLHLRSLQLPSANLSGTLPPELGELSTLQSLYLSVKG
ncbi:hypothetical protein L2E82_10942 [Cichorium intybus]|uniref:Uncharacterized protein n=1 Tax=Cichorium intybus TaxID=13427 RepID=A0ACB9GD09_CICIN|nr:hypothetical protein L2E82_10942 [Cichorium intybus]